MRGLVVLGALGGLTGFRGWVGGGAEEGRSVASHSSAPGGAVRVFDLGFMAWLKPCPPVGAERELARSVRAFGEGSHLTRNAMYGRLAPSVSE